MCFPVNPITLDAVSTSTYDPYAWVDKDQDALENISYHEWIIRRNIKFIEERDKYCNNNY